MNANIARYIALPIVSAGILGGAALGLAGMANAATTITQNSTSVLDRDLAGHLRQARAERDAGLAPPPRCRPAYHVQPVSPQPNRATLNRGPPRQRSTPGRASLVCH